MPKKLKRVLLFITGIFFIFFGLLGLVLPFLQGILFLVIGLILLSLWSPCMREWMYKHTMRYPKIHEVVEKVEKLIEKIIG